MRRILVIVVIIISIQQSYSQRSDLAFGLAPSYRANGYGVDFSVNYYHNVTDYYHISFIGAFANEQLNSTVEFPYDDYIVNVGYYTTILTWPNRGLSIFFGGGVSGGYENINNGNSEVVFEYLIPESGIVYGGFASFEMDFFLSNRLSIIVPITGMYHFNSNVDKSMLLMGAGIRYYLK